jgi:hypothetical protein
MRFDVTQWWIFWICFSIYSIYGFYEWSRYFRVCHKYDKLPFNGSLFKIVAMSVICGGITAIITVGAFLWTIVDEIRKLFRKNN